MSNNTYEFALVEPEKLQQHVMEVIAVSWMTSEQMLLRNMELIVHDKPVQWVATDRTARLIQDRLSKEYGVKTCLACTRPFDAESAVGEYFCQESCQEAYEEFPRPTVGDVHGPESNAEGN